jgi:16S rRNA (guanine527-N7)-methyltransferase
MSKPVNLGLPALDDARIALPILHPHLSSETLESLHVYLRELQRFSRALNLVSAATLPKAHLVHVGDALLCSRVVDDKLGPSATIYDFGSGNGIPGVILAALHNSRSFVCVDRDERKLEFIKHVSQAMGLKNVSVLKKDVEKLGDQKVQLAVSRGFGAISKTLLLCRGIFPQGGRILMMKSESWTKELAELPSQTFGVWDCQPIGKYTIPGIDQVGVVVEATRKA